ncbi:MAG: hypothetical protein DRJ05_14640 [Bacteroidetes bacterium]|nr:MAG: hypothetical protein DRJ05_14640 [Bacteroidota bacterium]
MLRLKAIIFLTILVTTYSFAQQADEIIGKYRLPNKLDVEIFKSNGKYSGKIIALGNFDEGQTTDINNPEKSKRSNPLLGMVIIKNLEFDKDEKQWINGEMYGPEKGMIFNLKITEMREDDIEAVGSKYFFWKTLKWVKI